MQKMMMDNSMTLTKQNMKNKVNILGHASVNPTTIWGGGRSLDDVKDIWLAGVVRLALLLLEKHRHPEGEELRLNNSRSSFSRSLLHFS